MQGEFSTTQSIYAVKNNMAQSFPGFMEDGDLKYKALGDWSEILHFFHHDTGSSAVEFLRNEIDNAMSI